MFVHSTRGAEGRRIMSSRLAWITQWDSISKNEEQNQNYYYDSFHQRLQTYFCEGKRRWQVGRAQEVLRGCVNWDLSSNQGLTGQKGKLNRIWLGGKKAEPHLKWERVLLCYSLMTKPHRRCGFNHRTLSHHSSGGWKSKVNLWTELLSSEDSLLDL